ncbi:Thaumatin [Plasmopara halstedii]|uniref:Thaumatin n=1 Tax=Plasmopara halstedii TaxID=4781 RepID=A0A0P1A7G7_PLAHL|nr:Thaumatin [Plasmopara halstedii]CEG36366.1 Thaumatin [Plasmopara halstedii]|eukprot:XP_024572735.1 Thaumatin [Plasmopara halstedii]
MTISTLSHAFVGLALLKGVAQGFNVYVYNKCKEDFTLAHVTQGAVDSEFVSAGGSTIRNIPDGSPSHVLKWGLDAQATLAEFSAEMNKAWYDISVIPTGPKSGPANCMTWSACKELTGGVGFNKPMQITPHVQDGQRCVELTCLKDTCADAYTFPTDDTKTHTCPLSTDFDVTFCPGGSGGAAPPPSQAPLPPPTSAPTPEPTQAPAAPPPEEQQEQYQQEQQQQEQQEQQAQQQQQQQQEQQEQEQQEQTEQEQTEQVQESESPTEPDNQTPLSSGSTGVSNVTTSTNNTGNFRQTNTSNVNSPTVQHTTPTVHNTAQQIGGKKGLDTSDNDTVQHINTQSESSGPDGTPYIVLAVGGFVGIVAAAAIFAVRKKKAALDEMESKTPVSAMPQGTLAGFCTPRNNVSVL